MHVFGSSMCNFERIDSGVAGVRAGDRALPPAPFAVTEGEEIYLDVHPVKWIYPLVNILKTAINS